MAHARPYLSSVGCHPSSILWQFNIDNTKPSTYKILYYDRHFFFVKYFLEQPIA